MPPFYYSINIIFIGKQNYVCIYIFIFQFYCFLFLILIEKKKYICQYIFIFKFLLFSPFFAFNFYYFSHIIVLFYYFPIVGNFASLATISYFEK